MACPHQAIYPGTFDPLTKGHLDIIERACNLFDTVIVAIAIDSHKKTLLDAKTRIALTKAALTNFKKVSVIGFSGLLVDFVKSQSQGCLLRGVRSGQDLDFESQLAQMNRQLHPSIETIFLLSKPEHAFISSSLVRELIKLRGNIRPFVPEIVALELENLHSSLNDEDEKKIFLKRTSKKLWH